LTEWTVEDNPDYSVVELYDYQTDPQETINIAELSGNATLDLLQKVRREG